MILNFSGCRIQKISNYHYGDLRLFKYPIYSFSCFDGWNGLLGGSKKTAKREACQAIIKAMEEGTVANPRVSILDVYMYIIY